MLFIVLRFTRNLRLKPEDRRCGLLEVPDLEEAHRAGIRLAQQHAFPAQFHALRISHIPLQSVFASVPRPLRCYAGGWKT